MYRPSINTLTSLTEKLSKHAKRSRSDEQQFQQHLRPYSVFGANNANAPTISLNILVAQPLNNINLSYSKSYLEHQRNMLQPSGDFIRPCHTAYLTKFGKFVLDHVVLGLGPSLKVESHDMFFMGNPMGGNPHGPWQNYYLSPQVSSILFSKNLLSRLFSRNLL